MGKKYSIKSKCCYGNVYPNAEEQVLVCGSCAKRLGNNAYENPLIEMREIEDLTELEKKIIG